MGDCKQRPPGINSAVLRYQVDTTSSAHVFYAGTSSTSSTELMRISGNGNVGIGVNPSATFHITAGQNGTERLRIGDHFRILEHSAGGAGASIVFNSGNIGLIRSAGNGVALCDNGGNVGIGTTAPSFLLDVNGKTRIRNSFSKRTTSVTKNVAGANTWTVADVESGYIVRTGLTGTTVDSMPSRAAFISAGYSDGDTFRFIVHNLTSPPQNYSLTATSAYNPPILATNVPREFVLRVTATGVDIFAISPVTY